MSTYELAIRNAAPRALKLVKSPADFEREATFAAFAVSNNADLLNLAKSDPQQLTEAVVQAVASGVSLNPALGLAYLVPRAKRIRLEFGYQGYIQLATASGSILDVFVETVHQGDHFKRGVRESTPYIDHEPGEGARTPENMTGVYCLTTIPSGRVIPCYMSRADVDAIKTGTPPWRSHYLEMAKKTVIRRARKTWPRQIMALERALAVDDIANDEVNPLGDGAIETSATAYEPPENLSNDQAAEISRQAMAVGMKIGLITDAYGVVALQDITAPEYDTICGRIEKWAERKRAADQATGAL